MLSSIANPAPSELLAIKKQFWNEECMLQANILALSNTSQNSFSWNKNIFLINLIHWFILCKHPMSVNHVNTSNGHVKWQDKLKKEDGLEALYNLSDL